MVSVNRSRIVSSSRTELLLAFHPSCVTSSRSSTFSDYLRESVPLEHLTRSQPFSPSQIYRCCHHDWCKHPLANLATWQWFRDCIRWILPACNNIQLQVTKCHSTLQPQMTCLQVSQTSSNSTSSCNTPCCRTLTVDLYRDIDHPVLESEVLSDSA